MVLPVEDAMPMVMSRWSLDLITTRTRTMMMRRKSPRRRRRSARTSARSSMPLTPPRRRRSQRSQSPKTMARRRRRARRTRTAARSESSCRKRRGQELLFFVRSHLSLTFHLSTFSTHIAKHNCTISSCTSIQLFHLAPILPLACIGTALLSSIVCFCSGCFI